MLFRHRPPQLRCHIVIDWFVDVGGDCGRSADAQEGNDLFAVKCSQEGAVVIPGKESRRYLLLKVHQAVDHLA